MNSQKNATFSDEMMEVNLDMGLKHALSQVVQQFVVAGKIPQYCKITIRMTSNIDETLCDFDNMDAFYALYETFEINVTL